MKRMPSRPKPGQEWNIGNRIYEISEHRRDKPTPGDNTDISNWCDRPTAGDPGGDATPVEAECVKDKDYPGKLVCIPEFDLLEHGRCQLRKDLAAGNYDFGEYFQQTTKFIMDRADEAATVGGAWPRNQADVDALEAFLRGISGKDPRDAMNADDFHKFLVGSYVCRQCY